MIEYFQFISVLYLCGLIWTVQVVHYPSFRFVNSEEFPRFHEHHLRRISIAVIPAMLAELICGIFLLFGKPSYGKNWHLLLLSILAIIWLSTFCIQVPLHNALKAGKDAGKIRTLVGTNWIRTFGWTARAAILSFLAITGNWTIG